WTAGNGAGSVAIDTWNTNAAAVPMKYSSAHFIIEMKAHRFDATNPYVDVLKVTDSDMITYHGGNINDTSIGIETTNVGWDWSMASGDTYNGAGAAKRPKNRNHYVHFANTTYPDSNM